jgi:hypothetical protein
LAAHDLHQPLAEAQVVLSRDRRRLDSLPPSGRESILALVAAFLPYYFNREVGSSGTCLPSPACLLRLLERRAMAGRRAAVHCCSAEGPTCEALCRLLARRSFWQRWAASPARITRWRRRVGCMWREKARILRWTASQVSWQILAWGVWLLAQGSSLWPLALIRLDGATAGTRAR